MMERTETTGAGARVPAVQTPSRLYRVLSAIQQMLPKVRTLWAARFPLLLAAFLLFFPLIPRRLEELASEGMHIDTESLWFVLDRWQLALVSLLASLSAFAVLIALRIVLLYGWRSGLPGATWTGSVSWLRIFAFHLLALPIVWTAIDRTARARADAFTAMASGVTPAYWRILLDLIPAAIAGGVAALGLLLVATTIQSIWRGARPDLFFPPNPLFKNLAGPGAQSARVSKQAQRFTRLGAWIVDNVPEEIGRGYIDYRVRRVLPGHSFAAVFAALVAIVYIDVIVWLAVSESAFAWMPPLALLLFTVMTACWILSAIAFFFDRYHIPILLPLGAALVAIELARRAVAGD
jgi:hypothetical protein